MITVITDHAALALARLAEQYKGKDRIEGLLNTLTSQVQDIEDALWQLSSERYLDDAVGSQLDDIGAVIGQARQSLSDDDYRLALRAKIMVNNSCGTAEELIGIFMALEPTATVHITDYPPAGFVLELNTDITDDQAAMYGLFLRKARGAGVRGQLLYMLSAPASVFTVSSDDTLQTSATQGLANTAQTTGGHLSEVIE